MSARRKSAPKVVGPGHAPVLPRTTVSRSAPSDLSCPVGALSGLPNLLRELGQDPWQLLESFGVTPAMMAQPMTPVPQRLHGQILQAAADATGRDDIGLMLGQRAEMENAGPLRLLVLNARTTREAIDSLMRYHGLWFRGLESSLTQAKGFACLAIWIEGSFPGRDLALTAYLAALVKQLEEIFPRTWRPSQVHISYRRPASADKYARFFRAPVLYDQPRHAVFFPAAALDETRPGSQQMLDSFLRTYLGELESREQPDFVARVRHVIDNLVAGGHCTIQQVAELFSVHRVTLHRYLREHGTTFEQLVDDARREHAQRMLERTDLPVGEIALALGYGSTGSFARAFRRWHGVTPAASRKRKPGIGRAASPARLTERR